jgi:nucleoside-diphosphate-sugar epimerase
MKSALIGYTGFIGSNLANQRVFSHYYNSQNIEDIVKEKFDLVVCTAAPGVKWLANQQPEQDWAKIQTLINCLTTISAQNFIVISSVDVYTIPIEVDEDTVINPAELKPYGRHRYQLELFARDNFNSLIVRLPGLFGKGLKKNIIYDLLNNHRVEYIHPDCVYQFYGLDDLNKDLEIALNYNLKVVNFATEPLTAREVAQEVFNTELNCQLDLEIARYNIYTKHSQIWYSQQLYLDNKQSILQKIKDFVCGNANK